MAPSSWAQQCSCGCALSPSCIRAGKCHRPWAKRFANRWPTTRWTLRFSSSQWHCSKARTGKKLHKRWVLIIWKCMIDIICAFIPIDQGQVRWHLPRGRCLLARRADLEFHPNSGAQPGGVHEFLQHGVERLSRLYETSRNGRAREGSSQPSSGLGRMRHSTSNQCRCACR